MLWKLLMAVLLAPGKSRRLGLAIPSAVQLTACGALGLNTVFALYHAAAVRKFELETFSRKLPAVAGNNKIFKSEPAKINKGQLSRLILRIYNFSKQIAENFCYKYIG